MSEFNSGLLRRCTSRNDEETELPRSACPLPAATLEHSHRIFPEKKYEDTPSDFNAVVPLLTHPAQAVIENNLTNPHL
jgi:hypothetical protein